MFDLVPLAGSRGIVANRDRHSGFIAQRLQMQLPGPRPVAIAASAVSADEQPRRPSVVPFPVQTPPSPDALGSELGGVVGYSDVDHGSIAREVISAIRNGLAFTQMREVGHRYLVGPSLGQPPPTPVFKGPHQFLLLGIHGKSPGRQPAEKP